MIHETVSESRTFRIRKVREHWYGFTYEEQWYYREDMGDGSTNDWIEWKSVTHYGYISFIKFLLMHKIVK